MLVLGESPPANVIKRKRSHDSDSSMANGGGRADEKDVGQLPSPVSGTGGPDAGKSKDGRTKAHSDESSKGKRRGGRACEKDSGDDRSFGGRMELRRPEVEGSDRSERGLLLEVGPDPLEPPYEHSEKLTYGPFFPSLTSGGQSSTTSARSRRQQL